MITMIDCPNCHSSISDDRQTCPNCGSDVSTTMKSCEEMAARIGVLHFQLSIKEEGIDPTKVAETMRAMIVKLEQRLSDDEGSSSAAAPVKTAPSNERTRPAWAQSLGL